MVVCTFVLLKFLVVGSLDYIVVILFVGLIWKNYILIHIQYFFQFLHVFSLLFHNFNFFTILLKYSMLLLISWCVQHDGIDFNHCLDSFRPSHFATTTHHTIGPPFATATFNSDVTATTNFNTIRHPFAIASNSIPIRSPAFFNRILNAWISFRHSLCEEERIFTLQLVDASIWWT